MVLPTKQRQYLLSTEDNPWNPWTHFEEWHTWDMMAGYHTLAYLARIATSSNELSQADQDQAVGDAIDEILRHNLTGNYIAVVEPTE